MPSASADRNLLFGILAVQMDFVAADQLIAAMNAWVLDKATPLGEHLVAAGSLAPDTHALIVALVEKHILQHGGQVERSLAALSSIEPLRHELSLIADADVQTSLAFAGALTPRGDRHATIEAPAPRDTPTTQRFRILRPHASGGLGKVSVARDFELNREVALKELHDRHADNLDSRARFLQEAEITGGLEHPGVVPIYGLGQYADGRPFYAMRFIRGDSLAQAIERFHRTADPSWSDPAVIIQLRRLLARLIDVCNALEYAHSRGVLHRDLKPGNIMLGQYGETLVVDWGLAKALGKPGVGEIDVDATLPPSHEDVLKPHAGSGSAPTMMGSAIGTPAFMSPEQAAGRLDALGPASDVYSLGATLYVLLTGIAPQVGDDLGEVIQRVQRGEFSSPRCVNPAVPRGLEAICLKAMALRPADRYRSPRAMADDIEAWLADEPVTALAEPWITRINRSVRKHRTLVSSVAAMLIVSLIGMMIGNFQLSAANSRERAAKDAAIAAKTTAEAATAEAERQVVRNEELLALARKSLERYKTLAESKQFLRYGMESLRIDLQEAALEFYETIAHQAGESAESRIDRADALYNLGSTYWQLGRMDDARKAFDSSLEILTRLEAEHPDEPRYHRAAAASLGAIGELLNNRQDAVGAEAPLRESRERLSTLYAKEATSVDYAARLAYNYSLEGERLRQLGRAEDAAATFAKGISILESIDLTKLDAEQSVDARYRLARALQQLAALETHALWKFGEAREHFARAAELMRECYQARPEYGDVGFSLVQILRNTGDLLAREHYYDEARQAYLEAEQVMIAVEEMQPDVPHFRQEFAELLNSIGCLHRPFEDFDLSPEALARLEQAVAIARQLVERYPAQVERKLALARYQNSLGGAYHARDRVGEATSAYSAAAEQLAEVSRQSGESVDALIVLSDIQASMGDQLADAQRFEEALPMLDNAESSLKRLIEKSPKYGEAYLSLAQVYISKCICVQGEGRLVDALDQLDKVVETSNMTHELSTAPWMRMGMSTVSGLSKTMRIGILARIRAGGLNVLADKGQFSVLEEQAKLLPKRTGEPSDHYVAAQALAYGADAALKSELISVESDRRETAGSFAAAAVAQLTAAWEAGYLRKSGGFSNLFRSGRTLKTLRESPEFAGIRDRDDFLALLQRIETEQPASPAAPVTPSPPDAK